MFISTSGRAPLYEQNNNSCQCFEDKLFITTYFLEPCHILHATEVVSSCFRPENVYVVSLSFVCVLLSYIYTVLWIFKHDMAVHIYEWSLVPQCRQSICQWFECDDSNNCPWEIVYISPIDFCVSLNNITLAPLPLGYLPRYLWRVGIFPVLTFYFFACLFWD